MSFSSMAHASTVDIHHCLPHLSVTYMETRLLEDRKSDASPY